MNVLSLFDGMSCGRIALERAGLPVKRYYACEIDKHAIQVSEANYPDITRLGSVLDVRADALPRIDLLIGGSPCQGFSFAGKQLNFDDPRSKLFFEFVRLLRECKPKYFLLENVKMKKEYQDVISAALGVEPMLINSALVSAQNRNRLYWTNLPNVVQPCDRGLVLSDVLESGIVDRDKSFCLDANYWKGGNLKAYFEKHRRQLVFEAKNKKQVVINQDDLGEPRTFYEDRTEEGKATRALIRQTTGRDSTLRQPGHKQYSVQKHGKANCLVTVDSFLNWVIDPDYYVRKLLPVEAERLQTVPDGYTACVSDTQRYRMLGNGWTIDVITHLLGGLREEIVGSLC
jgi:DNA-cytosine methyltransferase